MRARALCAIAAAILLSSCGYVGDPLPPALHIPQTIKDARAAQIGDKIVIEFTAPALTVESLPVRRIGEVDVRVGTAGAPFRQAEWESAAKRINVPGPEPGPIRVETAVAPWVGRELIVAARVASDRGRFSEWSNLVVIPVVRPLPQPAAVAGEAHPNGARLTWTSGDDRPMQFRIYRAEEGKPQAQIATSGKAEFVDRTVVFGKPYVYWVQASLDKAVSEIAGPIPVKPEDRFAPAAPSGLAGVAGPKAVELIWNRNGETDLKFYRIYRAEGAADLQVLADAVEQPAHSDRQVAPGAIYRYAVTALDSAGNESERSNIIDITTPQ